LVAAERMRDMFLLEPAPGLINTPLQRGGCGNPEE
jgi:hypothetical protein